MTRRWLTTHLAALVKLVEKEHDRNILAIVVRHLSIKLPLARRERVQRKAAHEDGGEGGAGGASTSTSISASRRRTIARATEPRDVFMKHASRASAAARRAG